MPEPQRQDPAAAAAMIDQIASQRMGVQPQQPPAQPQPGQDAPKKDTAEDSAAAKGSPETEGDKMDADAVLYEIEFGEGDKRKLTPQQIKSTIERYSQLNYKHAQLKPVTDLVEQIMRENPNMSPAQLRKEMEAVYKGQQHNPTMGGQQRPGDGKPAEGQPKGPQDIEADLKRWEEENAASLPPGYKEFMLGQQNTGQTMAQMQQQLAQTQRMLQQVLAQSQGVADAAKAGVQQGANAQTQAARRAIANNIDRVQAALQLPDDKAEDFMVFAAERGFTLEDFIDPQLTIRVMKDFKANLDSPEMDRLRQMAKRRQAFTGSLGSSPAADGAPASSAPQGDPTFDKLASHVAARRGIG